MLARLLNPVLPLPHTSVTFRGETANEMSPKKLMGSSTWKNPSL
jgi:hypothetical protein